MLSSAGELGILTSTRNGVPFSVLQDNKKVDFTALMYIFLEKLQLAGDCVFCLLWAPGSYKRWEWKRKHSWRFSFRAGASAGGWSSFRGCELKSKYVRNLHVVLHGLAG